MDEIDRVIAELTEAQRRTVLRLSSEWASGPQLGLPKGALGRLPSSIVTRGKSPSASQVCPPYRLTPLGLAVRARLQERSDG